MTLFASPDIAALVAAFPPPFPSINRPSLIKSLSGNNLYSSQDILARFRTLLETEPRRIRKSDLPSRLGIERADWLFSCYNGSVYFSKDGQSIVPATQYETLLDTFKARSREEFVGLSSFATDTNIALETVEALRKASDLGLRAFTLPTGSVVVGSQELVNTTKAKILSATDGATSNKVSLSRLLSGIPKAVVQELAFDALEGGDGKLEEVDDEEVVFIPSAYAAAQEAKQRATYESRIEDLLQGLEKAGFCEATTEAEISSLQARYAGERSGDDNLVIVSIDSALTLIALQQVLEQTLHELKSDVVTVPAKLRLGTGSSLNQDLKASLITSSSKPELAALLLRSEHSRAVEEVLASEIATREAGDRVKFDECFQSTVMAVSHLYELGVSTLVDATLKQHQDQYICDHLRNEIIPGFVRTTREQDLLNDKARVRETEKLLHFSSQAKYLSDVRLSISKFAKRQKIDPVSGSQRSQTKKEHLSQNVKAMQKTNRGSDVLQNLIWVLLAEKSEGLFMSSGKDTGRMIKQYQIVGDEETSRKLLRWRDALKSGKEGQVDLQEMREMARNAVMDINGSHDNSSDGKLF